MKYCSVSKCYELNTFQRMNFDPILHDFNVQLLSESPAQRLYGKAETLFFHFILVGKNNGVGYQTLTQHFFPRLGFSLSMLARLESHKNPVAAFTKKDLFPEYVEGFKPAGVETENGPEFFLDFGNGPLSLGLKRRNSVTSAILNDGIWYKKFAATGEAASAKAFIDAHSGPKGVKSSDDLLKMAEKLHVLPDLEYELSKGLSRGKRKQEGFLELVFNTTKDKTDISESLLNYWMTPLVQAGEKQACNCGNDYCFFNIVKPLQQKYFLLNYNDPNAVKAYWKKLSSAQKAILLFMDDVVDLSPMVAQSIFEEDFNIGYLSELLCQGHQPDSPYELLMRKFIALVDYFWGRQFAS